MAIRPSLAVSLILLLAACREDGGSHSGSPRSTASPRSTPSGWSDFHGIQYEVPADARAQTTDGVLPGPEGQGGIPADEQSSVVLILPGPRGFYLEIIKTAKPVSLEGMKHALVTSKVGSNHVGKTTSTGWDLTYDTRRHDDGATSKSHIRYFDLAGGHYQCVYGEANCGDPTAAEAVCRSIRPKPAK